MESLRSLYHKQLNFEMLLDKGKGEKYSRRQVKTEGADENNTTELKESIMSDNV
jgi:hypothetical protein